MEDLLIVREVGDLMFLEIMNEEVRKQSDQVSAFINETKQNSLNMEHYEGKKELLVKLIKSEMIDDENYLFLKEKLVTFILIILKIRNHT